MAGPAHQLIRLGETKEIRVGMLRDQAFGCIAAFDAAFPALGGEQFLAFPRRQIKPAHYARPKEYNRGRGDARFSMEFSR